MNSEQLRAHRNGLARRRRAARREKRQAALVHEGLVKALRGPVDPAGELGQALADFAAGLLASLGSDPNEDQRSLVALAVQERLLADSAAAYLAGLPVSAWQD